MNYRITPEGLAALREWLELAPLKPGAERILLIKLFFARYADPEVICGFVREPNGGHGFDVAPGDARTRSILRQAVAFARDQLGVVRQ